LAIKIDFITLFSFCGTRSHNPGRFSLSCPGLNLGETPYLHFSLVVLSLFKDTGFIFNHPLFIYGEGKNEETTPI
jgi:hypothetical protein